MTIQTIKKDKFIGTIFTGFAFACIVPMLTTTATIFTSQVDSFFLTMFMIVIPKYVRNSIASETFYNDLQFKELNDDK